MIRTGPCVLHAREPNRSGSPTRHLRTVRTRVAGVTDRDHLVPIHQAWVGAHARRRPVRVNVERGWYVSDIRSHGSSFRADATALRCCRGFQALRSPVVRPVTDLFAPVVAFAHRPPHPPARTRLAPRNGHASDVQHSRKMSTAASGPLRALPPIWSGDARKAQERPQAGA
jgi:hypothetical protein